MENKVGDKQSALRFMAAYFLRQNFIGKTLSSTGNTPINRKYFHSFIFITLFVPELGVPGVSLHVFT